MAGKGVKKTGGRTKGTPNKKVQDLRDKADALGVDPFEILLHFANGNWRELGYTTEKKEVSIGMGQTMMVDQIEVADRISASKDACQYIHPKRKAVEISNLNPFLSGSETIKVDLRWSDEDSSTDAEADPAPEEN